MAEESEVPHRTITDDTQQLLRRALQQLEVGSEMACNAVALWVYLENLYPKCEFQRSILPISSAEGPRFTELIIEGDTAVTHMQVQDSTLQVAQLNGLLVNTRDVLINYKAFSLIRLYKDEDDTRERFRRFLIACQNACGNLEDQGSSPGDLDGRTLEVYMMGNRVQETVITDLIHSEFGLYIERTVIEEDKPLTAAVVLQRPQDISRVLPFINFKLYGIQGKWVDITRKKKINCEDLELRPHQWKIRKPKWIPTAIGGRPLQGHQTQEKSTVHADDADSRTLKVHFQSEGPTLTLFHDFTVTMVIALNKL